jgi:hypothetical protein
MVTRATNPVIVAFISVCFNGHKPTSLPESSLICNSPLEGSSAKAPLARTNASHRKTLKHRSKNRNLLFMSLFVTPMKNRDDISYTQKKMPPQEIWEKFLAMA